MKVDLQSMGFPLTDALSGHARRQLQFALTRHNDRIRHVALRLGDDNGPRGGVDKFCRIQVHLVDAPVAVIEVMGTDMYAVIGRAAERVARVVVRHLDRSRIGRRALGRHENIPPIDESTA